MSTVRTALDAALDHGARQDEALQNLGEQYEKLQQENRDLRRRIEHLKSVLADGPETAELGNAIRQHFDGAAKTARPMCPRCGR